METKEGEIQFVKEDRKSFTMQGEWFNNKFKKLPMEFKKGSNVKINYIKKGEINYWQSIELIVKEPKLNNEPDFKDLDTTTLNTIIMSTKEIKIAYINNKIDKPFGEILVEILKSLEEKTIKIRVN